MKETKELKTVHAFFPGCLFFCVFLGLDCNSPIHELVSQMQSDPHKSLSEIHASFSEATKNTKFMHRYAEPSTINTRHNLILVASFTCALRTSDTNAAQQVRNVYPPCAAIPDSGWHEHEQFKDLHQHSLELQQQETLERCKQKGSTQDSSRDEGEDSEQDAAIEFGGLRSTV